MTELAPAARLAALYALVRPASDVADHWVQTHRQALTKGLPGWRGRRACAAHVFSYVGTQAAVVAAGAHVLGLRFTPGRVAAALAISATTHYAMDRRTPARRLAGWLGKGEFADLADHGINGAYLLDQAAHHLAELAAVAVLATGSAARD